MEGSGDTQGLCTSCSTGEAPAEVGLVASLSHILWFLCLKSLLVQAAGPVNLASWNVESAVPPTPSPGCCKPWQPLSPVSIWTGQGLSAAEFPSVSAEPFLWSRPLPMLLFPGL